MDNLSIEIYNATVPMKYEQPYGITVISRMANCFGVGAVILNMIFLSCICCIKDSDLIYNRFIQNLAVCDILGSITFLVTQNWPEGPFGSIAENEYIRQIWVQGLPYVFRSIPWMLFTAYMLTLNCLSVSQYLATCRPHTFMRLRQAPHIVSLVLGVVYAISVQHIIVPLLVLTYLSYLPVHKAFHELMKISRIEMIIWMLVYITSTLFSITLNACMYCTLKGSVVDEYQTPGQPRPVEGANTQAKHAACVTMWWLCTASIACRLPLPLIGMLLITYIQSHFGTIASSWVLVVVVLLLYLVFFVDPVIYLVRMPEVRKLLYGRLRRLVFCYRNRAE